MNRTQEILFGLMKDFDDICRENGIFYFVGGGTALGALRNGGFLEWDDDVDLFVTKETHMRLNQVMQKYNSDTRRWVSEECTPFFWNPIARFYDLTTTDIVKDKIDDGTPSGHCLEIFTLDDYPNDPDEQRQYNKYLWLYTEIGNPRFLSANLAMPADMIDRELYYSYRDMLETRGRDKTIEDIFAHMTYPADQCDYYCARWSYRPLVFKKEWVNDTKLMKFEGHEFPFATGIIRQMISNYDRDWNIIPPVSKRQTHESLENTEISYQKYEKETRNLCKKIDFNSKLHANKQDRVNRVFDQLDLQRIKAEIRNVYLQKLVENLNKREWNFSEKNQDYLKRELKEFFDLIFTKSFQKFGHKAVLSEDLYNSVFLSLIYDNRIDDAQKFIDTFKDVKNHEKYVSICSLLTEMKIERYQDNEIRALEYAEKLSDDYDLGQQLEVERTKLWCKVRSYESSEYTGESKLSDKIISALYDGIHNKEDFEIKKYIGDLYLILGGIINVDTFYKSAASANNGILVTDIKRKGFMPGSIVNSRSIMCLELLKEFDEICTERKYRYLVGAPLSKIIKNRKFSNFNQIEVYMNSRDMLKFVQYVEKKAQPNRAVEYIGSNKNYPFLSIRYINTETVNIRADYPELYKNSGLFLNIIPIRRYKPTVRANKDFRLERMQNLHDRYVKLHVARTWSKIDSWLCNRETKSLDEMSESERKEYFSRACLDYNNKENGNEHWILFKDREFKNIPAELHRVTKYRLILNDYRIKLPKRVTRWDRFLNGDRKTIARGEADALISGYVSLEEIRNNINNVKDLDEFTMTQSEYLDKTKEEVDNRSEQVEVVWNYAKKLYRER